jgi:hypothetical protein
MMTLAEFWQSFWQVMYIIFIVSIVGGICYIALSWLFSRHL